MRASQHGFRPGRGTTDALMLSRRMVEAACSNKAGGMLLVMLDWAKAFDILKSDCMCTALGRFGLPEKMVSMIRAGHLCSSVFHGNRPHWPLIKAAANGQDRTSIAVQTVMLHDALGSITNDADP
eukprot:5465057-Pyramimonas_sp.AAC.1